MRQTYYRLGGCLAVLFGVLMLAGTTFQGLNREHLGLIDPAIFSNSLNHTALSSAISAAGGDNRTVLVRPGTWTIGSNLTVPANVRLWISEGAVLSVSSGITLTINGAVSAPMRQWLSATGNVVFGRLVDQISPLWFGALCDDSTNDFAGLAKAFATASASEQKVIKLPPRHCRTRDPMNIPGGVSIKGDSINTSGIRIVGAIDGLTYDENPETNVRPVLEDLEIRGDPNASFVLLKIQGPVWAPFINRVRVVGSTTSCIVLDQVAGFHFSHGEIQGCGNSGITNTAWANNATVINSRLSDLPNRPYAIAAIDLHGVAQWNMMGNTFESGIDPAAPATSDKVLRLNGSLQITFHQNYAEKFNGQLIGTHTAASHEVSIQDNDLHSYHPFKIMFEEGSLAHSNVTVAKNVFGGVSEITRIFGPGASTSFAFYNNMSGGAEPLAYVVGYPNTTKTVIKHPDPMIYSNGIAIGDWVRTLTLNSNILTLSNGVDQSKIRMHVGGTDALDVEEEVTTFAAVARVGTRTFASLPTVGDGSIIYCSDCSNGAVIGGNCTAGGSGLLAIKANGLWKCY